MEIGTLRKTVALTVCLAFIFQSVSLAMAVPPLNVWNAPPMIPPAYPDDPKPIPDSPFIESLTPKHTATITVLGDVSGALGQPDGIVDMQDIEALLTDFNAKFGTLRWNPATDVNDDGVTNMRDIGIAIIYYGCCSVQ
jgi:hypothetical protein